MVRIKDNGIIFNTETIANLAVGASNILTFNWVPAFGTPGLHTILVEVDPSNVIYEINETNNAQSNATTAIGRADLEPTIVQVPTNPVTGLNSQVNVTINNIGDANATSFDVRLKDNGTIVDTKTVTSLAMNGNTIVNFNWVPNIGTPGLHTLLVEVDPLNNIYEHNKTNNNKTNTTTAVGRPDLIPTNVQVPTNPYTLISQLVNVTVFNSGDAVASNVQVQLKDNGSIIGTQTITSLALGASTVLNFNWIPAFGATGLHTLLVEVDPLNTTFEISDANNNITNTTTAIGRPDLQPTIIEVAINPYTGVSYPVNITVFNIGDAAATSVVVRLKDNSSIIDTQTITSLGIGANTILNFNWVPAFGTTGLHTILAEVDPFDAIYEINETNNQLTNTTNAIGRPDLTPTQLQTPINPYTFLPYTVNVTVSNIGDAAATAFKVELFDGTTSLGTKDVTNLGISANTILSWSWIPQTVGTHNLKTKTDINSEIYEINETNNEKTQNLFVTDIADLTVTNLTEIPTTFLNQYYTINVTANNIGTLTANSIDICLYDNNILYQTITLPSLTNGTSTTINFLWKASTAGTHNLTTKIDPYGKIPESNENNNQINTNTNTI